MIRVMLSVFDSAALTYGQPFFVPAVGAGVRAVGDEVNRAAADNPLYQHPDDFVVFELGTFDDQTGQLEVLAEPRHVARCKDLINKAGV